MAGADAELPAALAPALAALATALHREAFRASVVPTAYRVRVRGSEIEIPVQYEIHWRRFQTIPTQVVRDIAYLAKREASLPVPDDADCHAFAEVFVRDHVLGDTEVERPY